MKERVLKCADFSLFTLVFATETFVPVVATTVVPGFVVPPVTVVVFGIVVSPSAIVASGSVVATCTPLMYTLYDAAFSEEFHAKEYPGVFLSFHSLYCLHLHIRKQKVH